MDKFGVETDPLPEKKSAETPTCPECGTELRPTEDTGVLLCPKCGSKPFEGSNVPR